MDNCAEYFGLQNVPLFEPEHVLKPKWGVTSIRFLRNLSFTELFAPKAHLRGLQQRWDLKSQTFHGYSMIKFGPVPAVQLPIQPLGAPKIRCGTCLPAQKVFVKKVWEKFYVREKIYPESKIEDFRKSAFFLKKLIFERKKRFSKEKMNSSKKYFSIFILQHKNAFGAPSAPRVCI